MPNPSTPHNQGKKCSSPKSQQILHGQLAHKDQSFHRRLANSLVDERGCDSFRYDLRGQGGETEGDWIMGDYNVDADDLALVVDQLQQQFGYRIHAIIAHSRGSAITSFYLSVRPHPPIKFFANISGRYNMPRVLENKKYAKEIAQSGGTHYDWTLKIAGKPFTARITPEGIKQFAEWDNSYLISSFPEDVHVLTVHGDADEAVPVEGDSMLLLSQRWGRPLIHPFHPDAYLFDKIYRNRKGSGTHTLSIAPGETHNYTRPFDEPCTSIMDWLAHVDPVSSADSRRRTLSTSSTGSGGTKAKI